MFTKLRVYILQKLLAVLSREEGRAAVQTFYEVTVWSVAKDALTDFFSDATQWASDSSGWKAKLARPFTRHFHAVGQKGLGHIATAWGDNTLSGRTSLGPAMRALYADLAANKDQVSQKQLNYEIYKAQVDLGFDTLGNFAKIYAGLTAGPAGAEEPNASSTGWRPDTNCSTSASMPISVSSGWATSKPELRCWASWSGWPSAAVPRRGPCIRSRQDA